MPFPALLSNVPLRDANTFGFASQARWLMRVTERNQVSDAASAAAQYANKRKLPILVLGGGSNVLLDEVIEAPILQIATRGIRIEALPDGDALVHAEAGEPWHALVEHCARAGLWGIENLSLIPGTVGAAPVQNIGAYGSEIASCVTAVDAIDLQSARPQVFNADACEFGYRDSRFKREPGRWLIRRVSLHLRRSGQPRIDYPGVEATLREAGIVSPGAASPAQVANAIAAIRRRKLPDPVEQGNAGSFFKNPQISATIANQLARDWPSMPIFPVADSDERKVSAAWMIEACGWKGHRRAAVGVSDRHALVLVNHGGGRAQDILALAADITTSVQQRFGLTLEREPVVFSDTAT